VAYSDSPTASRASWGSRYVRTRTPFSVLDVGHGGERRLGHGPARLATGADAADCDDSVAEVPDLRVFDVDLVKNVVEVAEHLADALVPRYAVASPPSNTGNVNGTLANSRAVTGAVQTNANPLWIGANQPYGE
jgi:hypothetical protein